jgi:hypothetical protein
MKIVEIISSIIIMLRFNNSSKSDRSSIQLGPHISRRKSKSKSKPKPIYENNKPKPNIYENSKPIKPKPNIYENNENNNSINNKSREPISIANSLFYPNPPSESVSTQLKKMGIPNNNASPQKLKSIFLNNSRQLIQNTNTGENIAENLKQKKPKKKWGFFKKVKNSLKRNKKSKKKEKQKSVKSKSIKPIETLPVPKLSDVFNNKGRKWEQYTHQQPSINISNTPLGIFPPPSSSEPPHPNSMAHFQRSKSPITEIFKRGNYGLIRKEKKRIRNNLAKSVLSNISRSTKNLGNEPELLLQTNSPTKSKKKKNKSSFKRGQNSPLSKVESSYNNYQPTEFPNNQYENNQALKFNDNYMCNRANRAKGKRRKRLNCILANIKGNKCHWHEGSCRKKNDDYPCSKYDEKKCNSKKQKKCYWINNSCKSKKNIHYPCNKYNDRNQCSSNDGHKNNCYWKESDINGYPIQQCKKQLGNWKKLNGHVVDQDRVMVVPQALPSTNNLLSNTAILNMTNKIELPNI